MYEDFKVTDRWTGEQLRCQWKGTVVAIATRHADATDIRFSVNGRPLWIAMPNLAWVEQKRREGALLVDVRTDLQFDEAHIPGAVAITALRAGFGTKLAWVADRDQEIVLIGRDDEEGRRAAELATAVGIRKLGGFLGGGFDPWLVRATTGGLSFHLDELALPADVPVGRLHQRRDLLALLDRRLGQLGVTFADVGDQEPCSPNSLTPSAPPLRAKSSSSARGLPGIPQRSTPPAPTSIRSCSKGAGGGAFPAVN